MEKAGRVMRRRRRRGGPDDSQFAYRGLGYSDESIREARQRMIERGELVELKLSG